MTASSGPAEGPPWATATGVFDHLGVPVIGLEPGGRVFYTNAPAASEPWAVRRGSQVQDELFCPDDAGTLAELMSHVLAGEAWSGALHLRRAEGGGAPVVTTLCPALLPAVDGSSGQAPQGAFLVIGSLSASAGTDAGRLRDIAIVTNELLHAVTLDDVTATVVERLTAAAGATVGSLSVVEDDLSLRLLGLRGAAPGAASRWASYPVGGDTPAAEAVRLHQNLVLVGREEILRRYPGLESATAGERTMVCLPLLVAQRAMGVITLSFPGRREVDAAELQFLGILADTCAQTIDRIEAQQEAADRERKLGFLAEASGRLVAELDYESTLVGVAELAVPWFADWCAIALEDDGRLRTLAVAHAEPDYEHLVRELQELYPASPDAVRGGYEVLRSGESELVADVTDEILVEAAQDDHHLDLLRQLNFRSAMACPLKVGDRVLGVITWVAGERGRRFSDADVAFGEDLARRAAVAIDRSELHSQLREVAVRLQRAVLPQRLPDLAGHELAVTYLPAGRTGTGGDFYDVLPLDEGRFAWFVGDVMGRGVEATTTMAQMSAALRTLAAVGSEPDVVMTRLDMVFDRIHLEQLVSVVYGVVDPARDEVLVVNAGHPPPLLISPRARPESVRGADTLILGAGGGPRSVVRRPFRSGDALLAFTDGLVERRGEDADEGLRRLAGRCDGLLSAVELEVELRGVVDAVRDPTRDDDVAALVIRRA